MHTYRFKARPSDDQSYLWGGAGVSTEFVSGLFLTFRVEETGEEVEFGIIRRDAGAPTKQSLGRLKPGECYTVKLAGITGVYATCQKKTHLLCTIHGAAALDPEFNQ